MPKVIIKVIYDNLARLTLYKESFADAMRFVWQGNLFKGHEPLKIIFESTGKTLYADKQAFLNYINAEISMEELIELTQCEQLYRNKKDFLTNDKIVIEAGSLWKEKNKLMILIDDDQHVTAPIVLELFEAIE